MALTEGLDRVLRPEVETAKGVWKAPGGSPRSRANGPFCWRHNAIGAGEDQVLADLRGHQ